MAAIGSALAIDRWRCVAGVSLIVVGYWIKAKREEGNADRAVRGRFSGALPADWVFAPALTLKRAADQGGPAVPSFKLKAESRQLLHRIDTRAQPRLVARGGIPVQRALLDRLVECGHRLAVGLLGGLLVALLNGLAQRAQRGAQAGGVGAIGGSALRRSDGRV